MSPINTPDKSLNPVNPAKPEKTDKPEKPEKEHTSEAPLTPHRGVAQHRQNKDGGLVIRSDRDFEEAANL